MLAPALSRSESVIKSTSELVEGIKKVAAQLEPGKKRDFIQFMAKEISEMCTEYQGKQAGGVSIKLLDLFNRIGIAKNSKTIIQGPKNNYIATAREHEKQLRFQLVALRMALLKLKGIVFTSSYEKDVPENLMKLAKVINAYARNEAIHEILEDK